MQRLIRYVRLAFIALLCAPVFLSHASVQAPSAELLKPEQLEQLVAPIALYPDPLLAEVLMASTYPLEIVAADRWIKANKNLKGARKRPPRS
jgi:hypothetical protein